MTLQEKDAGTRKSIYESTSLVPSISSSHPRCNLNAKKALLMQRLVHFLACISIASNNIIIIVVTSVTVAPAI